MIDSLSDLVDLVPPLASSRQLVGIAAPPAAGKSTLAAELVEALQRRDGAGTWQVLGMDGFHLSNAMLESLGKRRRKGAPDTFDVPGFVALLRRLKTDQSQPAYLPVFHREIEESIAAEAVVGPVTRGVVVEGNYLLVDHDGWQHVRPLLDVCWYLEVGPDARMQRLIERATATYGSEAAGRAWATEVDLPNATLVETTRSRADRVIHR
jgi:pantothenate kinase